LINESALDAWSTVHGLTGLSAGLLGVSPLTAFGGAVAYEVVEYAHEWPRGSVLFGSKRPESPLNVATDLAIFTAAYWLGSRSPNKGAAALVLGVAAVIAYTLMPGA
jgi:hypothetical protein